MTPDLASARALAVENLRRRLPPARFTRHSGVYMLTLPGEGGHFEASLLLLDDVWAKAAPLVKGAPDDEGLKKVRGMVADAKQQGLAHQLTQQRFVRRDGAWAPFDAD